MTDKRTLIIFGATGDLASRLLLPGLGTFLQSGRAVPVQLIGTGRSARSEEQWKDIVTKSFASQDVKGPEVDATLASTQFIQGDPTDPEHLTALLDAAEAEPILYFALPPQIASDICEALQQVELPAGTTLAFEKPFGTDVASAQALNETVLKLVPEERVHRTDHFLGRTTVLNIIGLRFANRLFEPIWNADNIEKVDVFYDETLGLENRAQYYDEAGAMVDMIQSHLLQILGIVTMDAPADIDAVEFRSSLARVLRSTRLKGDDPKIASRRAVYTAGTIDGKELPSYQDEDGVDKSRSTETLAEISVEVDTARWKGVPFTLRSGKALGNSRKEVLITFKPVTRLPSGLSGRPKADTLRIVLNPDEIELTVSANGGGNPFEMGQVTLSSSFSDGELTPYGEVLNGIFHDDPLLSIRGDVAERCWEIVEPVVKAWKADEVPLEEYRAGSRGPADWESSS
ncbi:glucose-6-phosphate 1-dehydrogenase [Curtobacterium sp. PhB172]|uniref:glucose-6-phosphate dehydrogenase n=1 Tax=unclassified Curtobacterium TaxID=257496 RepID=UPI000F495971|nr:MULTISPECIES: glucose-6-phosphate dehydrogenase [unclassified Curtobacterium]ROQ05890.1 glucose-6-phosphate 1-dehydrogenase [Curtobacterium sp. PhB171]ROQ22963.1 glucose-6-phosphate 1-dehydrogenase [Curtobacterium sp. PhB170]ROS34085.1 glucose-6-phosphate 1-dehydrogenase [Curtobacterium sp. PhB131]ROS62968.1 glucose-6-phosphate 1-dehydrogenase [Curtobacterium sp. PhB172]ROS66684.1 glucose-6-phosphate 1-dehydrogenase [Curtobacterium sp. PhB141]